VHTHTHKPFKSAFLLKSLVIFYYNRKPKYCIIESKITSEYNRKPDLQGQRQDNEGKLRNQEHSNPNSAKVEVHLTGIRVTNYDNHFIKS
jgi:hypothetical protein